MGTHIIWRNPSPPRKRAIRISRIVSNHIAVLYEVITPKGYKRLFQVYLSHAGDAAHLPAVSAAAMAPASPRSSSLVSARW
jgi:phosphoribosylcarboxyaminoimidazole (NCAIR) mutase